MTKAFDIARKGFTFGVLPDPLGDAIVAAGEKPKTPDVGKPNEAPTRQDAEVQAAAKAARREAKNRRGRRSTILSKRRASKEATLGKRAVLGG